MQTVSSPADVAAAVARWRAAGETIALVPTMGDLHVAHLALVREARARASRVVVSIFVNPLQFNDQADFQAYPRSLQADAAALSEAQADLLFTPMAEDVYPNGMRDGTRIQVPAIADELCGAFRPGHFAGMATVVAILFNLVRPDVALFGEKDYQQLLIVRRMVEDLHLGVHIVGVATLREADGLAFSSRNRYLDAAERRRAPELHRVLCELRDGIAAGRRDYAALAAAGTEALAAAGFRPEYISVRREGDLAEAGAGDERLRILAAAWLGKARLIDNLPASAPD